MEVMEVKEKKWANLIDDEDFIGQLSECETEAECYGVVSLWVEISPEEFASDMQGFYTAYTRQLQEVELSEEELDEVAGGLSESVLNERMRLRERNEMFYNKAALFAAK